MLTFVIFGLQGWASNESGSDFFVSVQDTLKRFVAGKSPPFIPQRYLDESKSVTCSRCLIWRKDCLNHTMPTKAPLGHGLRGANPAKMTRCHAISRAHTPICPNEGDLPVCYYMVLPLPQIHSGASQGFGVLFRQGIKATLLSSKSL